MNVQIIAEINTTCSHHNGDCFKLSQMYIKRHGKQVENIKR
jgi:hypothetical protein